MSKSFEVQGEIHSIGPTQTFGQNGFTKREFVIKLTGEGENPSYPNYVALEAIKDKCALMDQYRQGDEVVVSFNLNGRLWNSPGKPEKCFTSLQAWRVELAGAGNKAGGQDEYGNSPFSQMMPDYDNDVPF
ncbi:DUF3127 domain-containing protein [Parathalassolituus penaei]|uniref:DUF3127 domain-containing protein n=1 Tax=Parathalassolituus penaei TaxID=2997323 RepID=A0A9X3IT42_9GAMM|nr:DUF3127 domain-containing protein [Parathalassolituus penaei]MCY0964808.1 DUF3127 domain-containing protein [Parathalassolituus penaei]